MPYTFQIKTLGCPVNQHEGRALAEAMLRAGFTETTGPADIYIINSCAVTRAAAAEARRLAGRAKKENPGALTVLAGCYPQVYWREIADLLPGVDMIVGTADRLRLPGLISRRLSGENTPRIHVTAHHPGEVFEELPQTEHYGRIRPVVKIQEGCDETCTYCIVRTARGLPRSLAPEKVLARVRALLARGYREIILAGTHLGTYGREWPGWNLARIIREICSLPDRFRLRLDYLEPMDVTDELLETLAASPKVCPFLYLPLQSGADRILEKMGRRYTAEDYIRLVEKARRLLPDPAVWTDLIAGFPGETAEDHRRTVSLVRELALSRLHVFPYSPRPGTAAAAFPDQVAPDVKKDRVRELRALGEELHLAYCRRFIGREAAVLVEKAAGGTAFGHCAHYLGVSFPAAEPDLRGSLVSVKILAARPGGVAGIMLNPL